MREKKENPFLTHNLQSLLSERELFVRVLCRAQQDTESLSSTIHELEEAIGDIDEAIEIKKTEKGEK